MLTSGARLGPYEIVAPLGAGGMGEVYKAHDTRLNRVVAIKILPASVAGDPQRRERFRREARAISSLTHPHICTLHDIGEHDGMEFLVLEYLPGETLAHRLLRGALPIEDVLRIAVELADALDAAHRAGLTHRDLKPANVMLTASGASVLDFGLAKRHGTHPDVVSSVAHVTVQPTLTQVGSVVGTIQYMAPEQVEGNAADSRSDLFSLGAIVYEMNTGRRAFEGSSTTSLAAAILTSAPAPMEAVQPVTPPALERVVAKCLAKDPSRRWQTAADLRDELAWIKEDLGVRAAPVGAAAATFSGIWKRPAWSVTIAAMVLTAIVLGLLNWPRAQAHSMPMRFAVLSPDDTAGVDVPIVSPDGRSVAFVARGSDGGSRVWVRPFDSLTARPLVEVDEHAFPFWSPDSRFLAFFGEGKIKKIEVSGGPVQILSDAAPSGRGGTWNRDDVIVFAPAADGPLYRIAAKGGVPIQVTTFATTPAERTHRFPHFLPDGRHFTYSAQSDRPPRIMLGSLASPDVKPLIEGTFSEAWAPPGYLLFLRNFPLDTLMMQPFDAAQLRLTDQAVPIVDRVKLGASGGNFAFSASDNGVLAYATYGVPETQLTWVARAGRGAEVVGPKGEYKRVSIAPDGRRAAVVRINQKTGGEEIWIIDMQRGSAFPLTSSPPATNDPVWSPDGTRVAFLRSGPSGFDDIFVRPSNASGDAEGLLVVKRQTGQWFLNDWSPDGRFILFGAQEGPTAGMSESLWVLPLGDRRPRPFLKSAFRSTEARFSPDGRWISYTSDESGAAQVYVQSFPDPAFRSQVSIAGGSQPHWRRDGKELFYLAIDRKLMAVPVGTTPGFEAGVPVALFELPNVGSHYDVAADGRRFLVTGGLRESAPSPAVVVLNWTAGLKK
jgi:Tol biopolymer transport system component